MIHLMIDHYLPSTPTVCCVGVVHGEALGWLRPWFLNVALIHPISRSKWWTESCICLALKRCRFAIFSCSRVTHSASVFSARWTSRWACTISSTREASSTSLAPAHPADDFGWFSALCRPKSSKFTHLRFALTVHQVNLVKESTGCAAYPGIWEAF